MKKYFNALNCIFFKSFWILVVVLSFSYSSSFLIPDLFLNFFNQNVISPLIHLIPAWSFTIAMGVYCCLLVLSEKKKLSFSFFLKRFQIHKIKLRTFLISLVAFFLLIFITGIYNLILANYFNLDEGLMVKRIVEPFRIEPWVSYLLSFGILLGSIMEELVWRGYLLPIQEKLLGNKAWIINGLLWALSHIFVYNPLKIIFLALGMSYIAQRYKNISYTIILHLLMNFIVILMYFKDYGVF